MDAQGLAELVGVVLCDQGGEAWLGVGRSRVPAFHEPLELHLGTLHQAQHLLVCG